MDSRCALGLVTNSRCALGLLKVHCRSDLIRCTCRCRFHIKPLLQWHFVPFDITLPTTD